MLPSPISDNYVTIEKGLIHFKYLRIEFEAGEDDSVILSELSFAYCNYETEICPIDDDYPSVGEYMYSYKTCGYGYSGYKTRFCDGFKFGEENRDNCIERPPKNLHYSENQMNITSYTPFTSIYPIYDNIINYYRISKRIELNRILMSSFGELLVFQHHIWNDFWHLCGIDRFSGEL